MHASPTTVAAPLPAHFPTLDGLRGLAILLVLTDMLSLHDHAQARADGLVGYVFLHISDVGWTGVQLFFVLSGFLITGILLDTQRAPNYYRAFYTRRTLRIFPLYFSVLALAFLIWPRFESVPPQIVSDQPHQLWLWTYTSNWVGVFGAGSVAFPHFWSLAVEEQFYLLWPVLLHSRTPKQCLKLCVIASLASLALRGLLARGGVPANIIYQNSFCRMDALALGGATAALLRVREWRERVVAWRGGLWWAALGLALVGYKLTQGFRTSTLLGQTLGYTLVALMFGSLLLAAASCDVVAASGVARMLRLRPLRALGKYSYAMYVLHKPLHDYWGRPWALSLSPGIALSASQDAAYVLVGIGVTFVVALLSWHLFEKHFLELKERFAPKLSI